MDSRILENEALKLSPMERAQLIEVLLRSLDPAEQASIDQAWVLESMDRFEAFEKGELKSLEGNQALKEIENSLGR